MKDLEEIQKLEKKLSEVEKSRKESEWLEGFEDEIKSYTGEDEVVSFQELREILEEEEDKPKMMTGMKTLDRTIGGLEEGDLIVISAPTGMGKTSLGRTLTTKFWREDERKSFWLSYEMRPKVFLSLFEEGVVGYLPKRHIAKDLIWAERKVVEAIAKYDVETIFIDHLHYLVDMASHQSISWRIGEVMRALKGWAIRYGIVIFLIAHTRKTETNQSLGLSDVRDSSFILQEADFVLMLRRLVDPDQTKGEKLRDGVKFLDETNLMVKKNRRTGRLTTIRLKMEDDLFYEKIDKVTEEEVGF